MYNTLAKNGTTIAFGLGALVVAIFLISVFTRIEDTMTIEDLIASNIFDLGLYLTIFLAAAGALAVLVFGLLSIVTDFKGAMKGLIGVAVLVVIFFVAYSAAAPAAEGTGVYSAMQKYDISEGVSKFISGAIITTLVTLAIAVISLIGSAIVNIVK